MEFKTPTIEDKEEIDRCILADDTRSCDYATANIILWSPFLSSKVCDHRWIICLILMRRRFFFVIHLEKEIKRSIAIFYG